MTDDDERRYLESKHYRSGGSDPDEYDNQEPEADRQYGRAFMRRVDAILAARDAEKKRSAAAGIVAEIGKGK